MGIWTTLSAVAVIGSGSVAEPELRHVVFDTGEITVWSSPAPERAMTPASLGEGAQPPLSLPSTGPALPVRGSNFSTLFRARDLFDLSRHPATTAAKLFRLTDDGERQGTACTAQFVGPRHLVTAAHCLIDRTAGRPHPGFEIAVRHDGGADQGLHRVIAAWAPAPEVEPRPTVIQVDRPVDLAADCHDVALIEIDAPAGAQTGWLGMSSQVNPSAPVHRFSYPHESSASVLERLLASEDHSEDVRAHLSGEIDSRQLTEPDFSAANLYYGYGVPDAVYDEAVSERSGAVLPGRSGSAMIDADARVVAVMSRAALGENYSCRLTPALIGAFAAIAGLPRED